MKGYPKSIATKEDLKYLLTQDEFKDRAKEYLNQLSKVDDSKVTKAISPINPAKLDGDWNTVLIDNPMPAWKRLGFKDKQDIDVMVQTIK